MDLARVEQIAQALRGAPAWALPEAVAQQAKEVFGATGADLLVADYRAGTLASMVERSGPVQVDESPAGRCFAAQKVACAEPDSSGAQRIWLPVTARGDRLGVLALTVPTDSDLATVEALLELATAAAHELVAAGSTTDVYRRARRSARLTLAAEMQWDTLPARGVSTPDYDFCGQLEPAYAVCGDTFDWSAEPDGLTIAVVNGESEGIEAALVTSFTISALRNARRSGDDIAEQAALASDLMFTHYGGEHQLSTLLMRYQPASGALTAVHAGALPLLLRQHDNDVQVVELESQLPLGIVPETRYVEQPIPVRSGDRLVVVSDGVHASQDASQQAYSVRALGSVLRRTRMQPPGEAIRTMIRDVIHYHGNALDDDAVVVAFDVR